MSSCTAQQWFTCAQAGLQPLGHSYTLGTEETVKWGNSFEQTAAGPLLSVLVVIQQRINAMLPVSHPGHATLCATWGVTLGAKSKPCALALFAVTELQSQQFQKVFPCQFLSQISLHGMDAAPWDTWLLHEAKPNKQAVGYPWKIKDNWNSWAAPKKLCKKFSPKEKTCSITHSITYSSHIWLQVFMNTGHFF